MRKVKLFSNFVNKDKGFSFIEALVSLLIVSIISTVTYFAFSSSIKNIIKIKEKERIDFKIFRTEQVIRDIISSVEIPFWKTDFYFRVEDDYISCNYLNGNKKIETRNLPYPIKPSSFDVVYFEEIKPVGVRIEYEIMGQYRKISQTFATLPIGLYKNE